MYASKKTDLSGLEAFALGQGGYFDRRDALGYGLTDQHLQHHLVTGRFERILPGVYRLKIAPISPLDDYLLAWVWTHYRGAISHESALALYDLADILPTRLHVTVPRPFDRTSGHYQVHLSSLPAEDTLMYDGVRVTTPARSIADAAAAGTDPSQIIKSVHEALDRGLLTAQMLRTASKRRANQHRQNIQALIERALDHATA